MPHSKVYNLTDHWFPDKMGGSCIYAYKLHRLLSERVDIETVTLSGEKTPCEEGMVVHKVLHKSRFLKNRRIIRGLCADSDALWVVHSPWFFFHLFIALGFRVRKHVVAVYHGPWFREYLHCASAHRNIVVRVLLSSLRYLVEVREFLLKGSHRHGMDDIKRTFEADRIRQEILAVLRRIGD